MRYFVWVAIFCFVMSFFFADGRVLAQSGNPTGESSTSTAKSNLDQFEPRIPPRAVSYHRVNRALFLIGIAWKLAGFWVILKFGILVRARNWAEERLAKRLESKNSETSVALSKAPRFSAISLCFVAYSLFTVIWNLPIGLSALAIEWRFGFSHESLLVYFKDVLTNFFIGLSYCLLLYPGFWVATRFPRRWWLWVWAVIVPLSVMTAVIYPVAISPLFNRYARLPEGQLRREILILAQKAGLQGAEIFVEDTSARTSHVNAYVIGIGPTTRIVLNDTAIKELPEDQILAVMGHEMGHYAERHIWIGLAVGAVGSGFLLWVLSRMMAALLSWRGASWRIRSLNDPAAIPLLFLCIYLLTLAGEPFGTAVSRQLEHRADAYGLRLTHLNDASARLFVGFAERDFSDPDPPLWLHLWLGTHPTLKERISFARGFKE